LVAYSGVVRSHHWHSTYLSWTHGLSAVRGLPHVMVLVALYFAISGTPSQPQAASDGDAKAQAEMRAGKAETELAAVKQQVGNLA